MNGYLLLAICGITRSNGYSTPLNIPSTPTESVSAEAAAEQEYRELYNRWEKLINEKRAAGRVVWFDKELREDLGKHADRHLSFLRTKLTGEPAVALILQENDKLMFIARKYGSFVPIAYSPGIQAAWLTILDDIAKGRKGDTQ